MRYEIALQMSSISHQVLCLWSLRMTAMRFSSASRVCCFINEKAYSQSRVFRNKLAQTAAFCSR